MSHSRLRTILIGALAALAATVLATAAPLAGAAKSKPAKVRLWKTNNKGKVLANRAGFTLYVFTRDSKNKDTCVTISNCTGTWPVFKTKGKPIAGKGIDASKLGAIKLGSGVKQVTYAGHPLYRYTGDSAPGQTDYVGTPEFGGTWYAINAAGKFVK